MEDEQIDQNIDFDEYDKGEKIDFSDEDEGVNIYENYEDVEIDPDTDEEEEYYDTADNKIDLNDDEQPTQELQYYKFILRYSDKTVQDEEIWVNEILPNWLTFLDSIAKRYQTQLENTTNDDEEEDCEGADYTAETIDEIADIHTLNLSDSDDDDYYIGETGPNNYHFQTWVYLKSRIRQSTLINKLNKSRWRGCEVQISFSDEGSIKYCQKSDTAVPGTSYDQDGKVYDGSDVRHEYKGFQNKIMELANSDNSRHIHWIYQSKGNIGKSYLLKKAVWENPKQFKNIPFGTSIQISGNIITQGRAKCYFLDIPRSIGDKKDQLKNWICTIEMLINGVVSCALYGKHQQLMMEPPNVIILSNENPKYILRYASRDRWKCWRITGDTVEDSELIPMTKEELTIRKKTNTTVATAGD
jgi:hypothetical protein